MHVHRINLPQSRLSGRYFLICFFFFALTGEGGFLGGKGVAFANRKCFHCVWIGLIPIERKFTPYALTRRDNCRPGNFDSRNAQLVTCQSDCVTTILYDYIETNRLQSSPLGRLRRGFLPSRNSSFVEFDPKRTVVMSVFIRGCAKKNDRKRKDGCNEYTKPNKTGTHVFQQKCFCSTQLCNDEIVPYRPNSACSELGALNTFWVLPLWILLIQFV